jgi:hypothetical protein
MAGWKRVFVAVLCLAFAVGHAFVPDATVDAISVWLIGIASLMFLLPDLQTFLPYLRRVRVGDTEIELARLGKEVEQATESIATQTIAPANVDDVLKEAGRSPQAALLLLSSKMEEEVRERLRAAGVKGADSMMSLPRLVERGVEHQVYQASLLPALQDFWAARNDVAHGRGFDVSDQTLYALISLGVQLFRALQAR